MPSEQFVGYITVRTKYISIRSDYNNDVRLVLDQHAELDFFL